MHYILANLASRIHIAKIIYMYIYIYIYIYLFIYYFCFFVTT